ncbi:MAG: DoxX family protein [Rhodothermales bacterium]
MQQYIPLIGRILFSMIFIMVGFMHFMDVEGMSMMVPSFLPAPAFFVYLTGLMLVAGGFSVLLGYKAKIGGLILAAFLMSTSLLVFLPQVGGDDPTPMMMMLKDMSMAGGALLISYFGAGPISMDAKNAVS